MEILYCPVCSITVNPQAGLKSCPNCHQPLVEKVWKETRARLVAYEKAEIINEVVKKYDKEEQKRIKKEEKEKIKKQKKRHKNMTVVEREKERIKKTIEKLEPDKKIKTITRNALIRAYKKQKRTNGWTFYNENDIVQRTLETRFNFLLIAYTIILTAYFNADYDIEKIIILLIGLALVIFLGLGIHRTTKRFNITLDIVHSLENDDVSPIIHKENGYRHSRPVDKKFRNNSIHGILIPRIMILTFYVGITFHIIKIFVLHYKYSLSIYEILFKLAAQK